MSDTIVFARYDLFDAYPEKRPFKATHEAVEAQETRYPFGIQILIAVKL